MGQAPARRIKYNNIALALAVMLLFILAVGKSCQKEDEDTPAKEPVVTTTVKQEEPAPEPTIVPFKAEGLDGSFHYLNLRNADSLGKGDLILLNAAYKYEGEPGDLESNYRYLFDSTGTRIASASATVNQGCKRTLTAFNEMVADFYNKTGKATIMITDIYVKDTEGKDCYEHESGLAFDLRLYYESEGTFPEFTGTGDYAWFSQNAYKYGLILRYPADKTDKTGVAGKANHFRYVGKPHAELMRDKEWCLEEFLTEIKKYTLKEPLSFESEDGTCWALYYCPISNEKTTNVPIPLDPDGTEYYHSVSGDNREGYIITVRVPSKDPDETEEITVNVKENDNAF
ncbi:MAG: D-alanyl-D-alanine carboxypeptidase family protein [Ruminococcus sp.]|nr:D-alanyl-D-alanine carboxypeptidase family protein [Ruminococcus sp.]